MRILHTSDWHLGRTFGSHALLDDQARMLDRIVELVTVERIDLVVIAGDVYDRAIPSNDAVVVLRDSLKAIRAAGARIALIAGTTTVPSGWRPSTVCWPTVCTSPVDTGGRVQWRRSCSTTASSNSSSFRTSTR